MTPYQFPKGTRSMLLTDDFNPMDVHDAWLRERVRREILETTDWSILLSYAGSHQDPSPDGAGETPRSRIERRAMERVA
jgi:hypothetical protein